MFIGVKKEVKGVKVVSRECGGQSMCVLCKAEGLLLVLVKCYYIGMENWYC